MNVRAPVYPNARAVGLAAAMTVPALGIAIAAPGYWYAGLIGIAFVLALVLVDGLSTTPGARVGTALQLPSAAFVGQSIDVDIDSDVEARLEHDDHLTATGRTLRAVRRGRAVIDALWQRWPGRFGLAWRQRRVPVDRGIAILPDIRPARAEAVRLFRRDASLGQTQQIDLGQGGEFQSMTEFRAGMDRRAIDWKASARHGGLIAKEWRTERNNDIVFAMDTGRTMCEPVDGVPRVDRAIAAALASAFVALKIGDRVSLFGFGARPRVNTGPMIGVAAFATFQRLAAELDYSAEETNFTFALSTLAAGLTRRSLIVIFTEIVDATSAEAMLATVGRLVERHLILFVTMRDIELEALVDAAPSTPDDVSRAVIAASLLRERRIVIARLQRLGAHIVEASHERLGHETVNAYLALKRRNAL